MLRSDVQYTAFNNILVGVLEVLVEKGVLSNDEIRQAVEQQMQMIMDQIDQLGLSGNDDVEEYEEQLANTLRSFADRFDSALRDL